MTIVPQFTKKSIVETHPRLALEWACTNDKAANDVTKGSEYRALWVCSKDSRHQWEAQVYNRSLGKGCPFCAGKRVSQGVNDLFTTHPELKHEWHEKNTLNPLTLGYGSDKMAWWRCSTNPNHEWKTKIGHRGSSNSGCPKCCTFRTSGVEQLLKSSVAEIQGIYVLNETRLDIPWGTKTYMDVDIRILGPKGEIILEFDGAYWHDGRYYQDLGKTETLLSRGFSVIRVREGDLGFLDLTHPNLYQLPFKWNHKSKAQNVTGVVNFITTTFTTDQPSLVCRS